MFTELKKQEAAMSEYKKASRGGASGLAKLAAYFVAIAAIAILSLIFAQTTSGVFQDPTMKIVGIFAAMVVGGSSIVFLLFKGKLLISRGQFIAGCLFLAAEMTLLTLGAIHAFGSSLGWTFDPFVNEAAKLAVVLTFPLVAIEWIVVLALDPHESSDRADNMSRSALAKKEREARERFRISDPVMKVRNAAAMTEVINEEMLRLPTAQRGMFASILKNEYGDQFEGVQLFLTDQSMPNVIDQPQSAAQPPAPKANPVRAMFSRQQPPAQPQTMAADGYNGTPGKYSEQVEAPPSPKLTVFDKGWEDNVHAHIATAEAQRAAQQPPPAPRPATAPAPKAAPKPDVLEVERGDGTVTRVAPGRTFTVQAGMDDENGNAWPPGIYQYDGRDRISILEEWGQTPKAG